MMALYVWLVGGQTVNGQPSNPGELLWEGSEASQQRTDDKGSSMDCLVPLQEVNDRRKVMPLRNLRIPGRSVRCVAEVGDKIYFLRYRKSPPKPLACDELSRF